MSELKKIIRDMRDEAERGRATDDPEHEEIAEAFDYFADRIAKLEAAERGAEPVATVLPPDPYDERDGVWFNRQDYGRLSNLPAGTKLYADKAPPAADEGRIRAEVWWEAAEELKGSYDPYSPTLDQLLSMKNIIGMFEQRALDAQEGDND